MYVQTFEEKIRKLPHTTQVVRIKTNPLDFDRQVKKFMLAKKQGPTVYHIDIAFEVFKNVDLFLFNLLIMGFLKHSNGNVWKKSNEDFFFIEMMPPYIHSEQHNLGSSVSFHSVLNFLPKIEFRTPKQYLYDLINLDRNTLSKMKDTSFERYFLETKFQRTCLYIQLLYEDPNRIGTVNYSLDKPRTPNLFPNLSQIECLKILLERSQLTSPNWAELHNFVNFLDDQLDVFEHASMLHDATDLRFLVGKYLILMAYDFGLPSLNVGEDCEIFNVNDENQIQIQINKLEIARTWQNTVHPYIVFTSDRETFLFMGVYLDRRKYQFINPNTEEFMEPETDDKTPPISSTLRIELLKHRVSIYDNFNTFPRTKKINSLRRVMGLDEDNRVNFDPDPSYELTLDNCLKLSAIHMRFRANLPVVITGETGCGKTRLMKFYSELHKDARFPNMNHIIHFKIHGGITAIDIEAKLKRAEALARSNKAKLGHINKNKASLILFFDEANTTEDIGLIKEIMCDSTCNGRKFEL
jgi:hypothetical protein